MLVYRPHQMQMVHQCVFSGGHGAAFADGLADRGPQLLSAAHDWHAIKRAAFRRCFFCSLSGRSHACGSMRFANSTRSRLTSMSVIGCTRGSIVSRDTSRSLRGSRFCPLDRPRTPQPKMRNPRSALPGQARSGTCRGRCGCGLRRRTWPGLSLQFQGDGDALRQIVRISSVRQM